MLLRLNISIIIQELCKSKTVTKCSFRKSHIVYICDQKLMMICVSRITKKSAKFFVFFHILEYFVRILYISIFNTAQTCGACGYIIFVEQTDYLTQISIVYLKLYICFYLEYYIYCPWTLARAHVRKRLSVMYKTQKDLLIHTTTIYTIQEQHTLTLKKKKKISLL